MAAYRGVEITWTRRPKFSVIQRGTPVAVESHEEGHTPNSGCGRVFSSTVILAKRGSPRQGLGSTSSFPRQNHPGDSRAKRENDSRFSASLSLPSATNRGIASSQSPLGSASALRRKLRPLPCSSFSAAIRFAGFASETRVVASLPLNDSKHKAYE